MSLLIVILTLVLIALVVSVVGAPLRRERRGGDSAGSGPPSHPGDLPSRARANALDDLESAREAKYREIRDAELDYRTGKLSREDFETVDAELRAEAIEILNRVEEAEREAAGNPGEPTDAPEA